MKAAFFLGRIHHALKLITVMRGLDNANCHIDVVVADNSININPTTEYLYNFGFQHIHHVNDYAIKSHTPKNDIAFQFQVFGFVPPFWALSSLREFNRDRIGFINYLDENKPDFVFGLHENNFWVKLLFYLAQERGIPTYSLMEGIILDREERDMGKYSIGTDYTSTLFSWSDDDKEYYSDPEKIYPVGPVHLDEWVKLIAERGQQQVKTILKDKWGSSGGLVVFAPPRLDLYQGDFNRALIALAEWTQEHGFALLVKLHPFQGGANAVESMVKPYNHVRISLDADSIQYVAGADILITQTSTIAVEGLCLGIPVAGLDMDYIGLEQLVSGMALIEGNNLDAIPDIINMDVVSPLPLADGNSTQRIVDYVTK